MTRPNTQNQNHDQNQSGKPVYGNNPIDPDIEPGTAPDEPGEDGGTIEPGDPVPEPVKSRGIHNPDNTFASAGDYYEEYVMGQAGDDLEQLKLNPGDKGTQAHQGYAQAYSRALSQA